MKLSQIFEQLTTGELSQVKLGGGAAGSIAEEDYRSVGNHVQLGLTDLFTRFNLKQNRLTLQLFSDVLTYPLQSKYAVNGTRSLEPKRWIIDENTAPFKDDIIKILAVKGQLGYSFVLNDYTDNYSIITPTLQSLRVPFEIVNPSTGLPDLMKTTTLDVQYQANHPAFMPRVGYFDPERAEIELPDSHLQALLYFVASRVHNPIGMGQEFNAGNTWYMKYAQECQRLEFDGLEIDSSVTSNRARRNGWV